MLAQIGYCSRRGLWVEEDRLWGLPVLRVWFDPDGFRAGFRLKQAGRLISRKGIRRAVVPEGFEEWRVLNRYGVRSVETEAFLRAQADGICLAALSRVGKAPQSSAVALRGTWADGYIVRSACRLCAKVRDICISIPGGGERLREYLRMEYGVAVRPDFSGVEAAVRFAPTAREDGGVVLDLFDPKPDLGAVQLRLEGEVCPIPVAATLWQAGKVRWEEIEIS